MNETEELRRIADITQQKAEEDAARERLGLTEGQELGTLFFKRNTWKKCRVHCLGDWVVILEATRGTVRNVWKTNARLIEQAKKGKSQWRR